MKGSAFVASLPEKPGVSRDARILDAVRAQLFLPIEWAAVTSRHEGREATIFVSADALSIGEPGDSVRVNVSHTLAQQIADVLDAALPTARISDLAFQQAKVVLRPRIQPWDKRSVDTSRMVVHSDAVEARRAGRAGLVRVVGKDWVLTNKLEARPDRGANYGWHTPDAPYKAVSDGLHVWQPLATAHDRFHVDYSQVLCLVRRTMLVDGVERDLDEVLTSAALCGLVSHEGVLRVTRHPAVPRATRSAQVSRDLSHRARDASEAPTLSAGLRALRAAERELELGVKETPAGSNSGPRIREYLRGCVRDRTLPDGSVERFKLNLSAASWCAAFASWCAFADARDEEVPHRYRASVAELWRDAVRGGAARPVDYTPTPGDLVIFMRAGNDPRHGGVGHVGRVSAAPDASGHYETIEGNAGDKVARVRHKLGDCVGWIACNEAKSAGDTELDFSVGAPLVDLAGAIEAQGPSTAPTVLTGRYAALHDEYARLFSTCVLRPQRVASADAIVDRIVGARGRYEAVEASLGVPWYVIAIIHSLEGGLRFTTHLHNGDPLTKRTVHVPAGRPTKGDPPFTWEASAADALKMKKLHEWPDWSAPGILYQLERFNGFGYHTRQPPIPSPYLWSFTTHYTRGKYVADGKYDPSAVSAQCGGAALLLRMIERGIVHLAAAPPAPKALARPRSRGPGARAAPVFMQAVTVEKVFRVGETDVRAVQRTWGSGEVVHLNVHDDENTSVEAAEAVLAQYGGRLIELRHRGGRRVQFKLGRKGFSFDPNRIFSDQGAKETVSPGGSRAAVAAAREFARSLLDAFNLTAAATLVALHNNSPGSPLTIGSYAKGGPYQRDAAAVTVAKGRDPDDFFLVTTRALYESLATRGFNVVLQDNGAVRDDGSLSVYCGQRGVRYVNVESRHGHRAEQERMLSAALDALSLG